MVCMMNIRAERDLRDLAHTVARSKGLTLSELVRDQLAQAVAEHGFKPPASSRRLRRPNRKHAHA